jgi:hypothetical protein
MRAGAAAAYTPCRPVAHHPRKPSATTRSVRKPTGPPPLPMRTETAAAQVARSVAPPPLLYSRLVGRFIPSFGRGLVVVLITPPDPSTALGLAEVLLLLCYTLASLDGLYLCWVAHR